MKFEGVVVKSQHDAKDIAQLQSSLKDIWGVYFSPYTITVPGHLHNNGSIEFLPGVPINYHQMVMSKKDDEGEACLLFDPHKKRLRFKTRSDQSQQFVFRNAVMVSIKTNGFVQIASLRLPVILERVYYKKDTLFEDFLPLDILCFENALTLVPANFHGLVKMAYNELQKKVQQERK